MGEEGHLWYCRTKTPCLQEGAGCPVEKEKVIFSTARLKVYVCRKEVATPLGEGEGHLW
jgi:hypothetical protein